MTGLALLAQLPESTVYIDPLKLGALAVAFALWAMFAAWVDKDTIAVNTFRVLWNLIVLGCGTAALLAALLVPLFAAGYPVFLVINLAVGLGYVIHRNKLVKPEDSVLTTAHFKRIQEQGLFGKKKVKEVKERVRLTAHTRKVVAVPEDEDEKERYRLAQDLFFNTLWRRAEVVEVAPAGPQAIKVTYHVDGVPYEGETLIRADGDALIQYVKKLAGLNVEERRKPQKGDMMTAIGENKHKIIVQSDGSTAGEKLAVRVMSREAEFKVPDLGFNDKQLAAAQGTKEVSKGLILFSAPSGCGLTTTIYSFTRNHDRFLQNVQTVEYEKEFDIDNVTQNLFNPADAQTFAERLLKLVRSDPDIIVLPDLREREAAAIACKAASEKQKVYAALPAVDVLDALRRWATLVGDKGLVAKSLLAVTNQRLVRKLCDQCKQAYKPDPTLLRKLNLPEDRVLYRPPEQQFDKQGKPLICAACQGTGYVGRTGVFEWLPVDDGLREVIRRSASFAEIQGAVLKRGGLGLQAQALQKVLDGVTSIAEVARAVRGEGGAEGGGAPARPGAPGRPAPAAGAKPAAAAPKPQPKAGVAKPEGGR
jgi:type II secretory ATPase GspE/PulE/Tfp pilus assembly ATPase PilB-like protein